MQKLIDMLEDSGGVQNVWHNWDNDRVSKCGTALNGPCLLSLYY